MARKLNSRQERFCQLFASDREFFMNGVQSYCEAYGKDRFNHRHYNVAKVEASKLLTKPNILERITELIELGGLNDSVVDKQLAKIIAQDADLHAKLGGIREYNKLKARITDKHELKVVDPLPLGKLSDLNKD